MVLDEGLDVGESVAYEAHEDEFVLCVMDLLGAVKVLYAIGRDLLSN